MAALHHLQDLHALSPAPPYHLLCGLFGQRTHVFPQLCHQITFGFFGRLTSAAASVQLQQQYRRPWECLQALCCKVLWHLGQYVQALTQLQYYRYVSVTYEPKQDCTAYIMSTKYHLCFLARCGRQQAACTSDHPLLPCSTAVARFYVLCCFHLPAADCRPKSLPSPAQRGVW